MFFNKIKIKLKNIKFSLVSVITKDKKMIFILNNYM